jgi:CBS domain containing-hemolysin-like protein
MKLFSWINEEDSTVNSKPPASRENPALDARLDELFHMSVKEAMIPRALIKALDVDVQLRRVRRLKSSKSLYFPVYKGDLDNILGWVSKQRVLELMHDQGDEAQLIQHVRPIGEIDESMPVSAVSDVFLKSASPILIVKNAQGNTSGIVTLAEFVEMLFGFEVVPTDVGASSDVTTLNQRNLDL